MSTTRLPIIVGDKVRAFLDHENSRTGRSLSEIVRSIIVDSREFDGWQKAEAKPKPQPAAPKTTTTVVENTEPDYPPCHHCKSTQWPQASGHCPECGADRYTYNSRAAAAEED